MANKRFISSFKLYFQQGLTNPRNKVKLLYRRFNEKWYKDKKFRVKCIVGFTSAYLLLSLFMNSKRNLINPLKTKLFVMNLRIDNKMKKFNEKKDHQSLKKYLDMIHEKINFQIENVQLLFNIENVRRCLTKGRLANPYLLFKGIRQYFSGLMLTLYNHITNFNSMMLKDEEMYGIISEYVPLFEIFYNYDPSAEKYKYDKDYSNYIKECISVYVNTLIMCGKYSQNMKLKENTIESFINVLKDKTKAEMIIPLVYDNMSRDFTVMILENLAKAKDNPEFKIKLINVLNDLIENCKDFSQIYFSTYTLSNIILHVYDDKSKDSIIKLLNSVYESKDYLHKSDDENIKEEFRRLNMISHKMNDKNICDILFKITS